MQHLAILYAPDEEEVRLQVNVLSGVVTRPDFEIVTKSARMSIIPDILAADIVIFCSADPSLIIHADFKELVRAFSGINLSGKLAAFASFNDNDSSRVFRKALMDTNIAVFTEILKSKSNTNGTDSQKFAKWVERLYAKYRGYKYD